MRSCMVLGSLSLALILLIPETFAVKSHDFKTCSQAGFCRRGRALSARAKEAKSWTSPYSVDRASIAIASDKASFTAGVQSSLYPEVKFGLELRVHNDGVVRVRMDEVDGIRKRYDEASSWALIAEPTISQHVKWTVGKKDVRAVYGNKKEHEIILEFAPLRVVLLRNGKEQIVLNGQGLLHMEHFRTKAPEETKTEEADPVPEEGSGDSPQVVMKAENPRAWFEGDTEDDWWEETFSSWTDSKPKGPESLSIDITFPNHGTLYGIPQHATRLALPTTAGESPFFSDPYRLYNADVFEYIASSPMSLYGSIPILHAHSADSTVGIFHAVASETWIDVSHSTEKSSQTHWISESGILDLFLMPGPTPADIFAQYSRLTGTPVLPAHWSLGYHQCRWNYVSTDDVRTVQKRFDEEDIPVDVFWLDIEYSEEHKYFIWDKKNFPDPVDMINDVAAIGRKMVIIVDPHLKRTSDYPVYQKASELGILVKPKSGEGEYEGWCWSGSSSWIDFFNPTAWDWWKSLFKTQQLESGWSWTESTEAVHIWNDMNEPSVFNGPEITMPKDNVHHGGWEHRDIHNVNGMLFSNLTSQAVSARSDPPKRPFVLTRAFYAGSQRFGAMWTGDNLGTWEHMEVGVKMVLANGIAGMSFAGSDVGGFFGNPDTEMLVRWYQVGAFAPFFRAHAHLDTKRREPFLLDQPYKGMIRDILRLRYSMLPVWYTAFRETTVTGLPVLRPHYVMFPKDQAGFDLDDQYYIGQSGLLVKPVTQKDVTETTVYLAENQVYYDYLLTTPTAGLQKARLSQSLLPFTKSPFSSEAAGAARGWQLYLARIRCGEAEQEIYASLSKDLALARPGEAVDGVSLKEFNPGNTFANSIADVRVEKIVVVGCETEGGGALVWNYTPGITSAESKEGTAGILTIKDPKAFVTRDWAIMVQF
ncbi:glycoside hydrolase family 31 protein [Infundibulicybe gibba]|nr:glycoside hydrolase family 31 protein [Infundibulicybe gibba]